MKKILSFVAMLVVLFFVTQVEFITGRVNAVNENEEGLTTEKEQSIVNHCSVIKDNLKNLQHEDSKVRVHLGEYYGNIFTDFITPLNVVLVANNMSSLDLIENQNNFALARTSFVSDYVSYQKMLEELVAVDCVTEPVRFYNKLLKVRTGREKVETDVLKLKSLINKQRELVKVLKEAL